MVKDGTVYCQCWFTGGGDPTLEASPSFSMCYVIDSEDEITMQVEEGKEAPVLKRSTDQTMIEAYEADAKVSSAINNLILSNEGPTTEVPKEDFGILARMLSIRK